jgi:Domain of unknown function (DUF4262)
MSEIFCQGTGPDMRRWLKRMIKQQGFGIMSVFDDHSNMFHYTIGNHGVGLPELLVIGGDQRTGGPLTDLAKMMRKRKVAFANGEIVSLGGKYPVKVIDANCPEVRANYTCGVFDHFKTRSYLVQQMLFSDRDGKFPDAEGCAEPYASLRVRTRSGMAVPWAELNGLSLQMTASSKTRYPILLLS